MDEITWTVSEPNGEVKITGKRTQLPYFEPFVVTEKTTKEMKVTIERWNLMQQRLLDTGEMKSK
jgi:hypothetical protein